MQKKCRLCKIEREENICDKIFSNKFEERCIYMRKEKTLKRPGKVGMVLVSILLLVVMLINGVVITVLPGYYDLANHFIGKNQLMGDEADEARVNSAAITQEVEEEGIVLLENKNRTLPLTDVEKVNLFGYISGNIVYGGSGSGSGDSSNNINLVQGLTNSNFAVNEELMQFYMSHYVERQSQGFTGNDYSIYEVPVNEYSDEMINQAKDFSDTAIVVIGRVGGEGYDLPTDMADYIGGDAGKHYLELQQVEIDLLNMVKENFENVIVVLNTSNAMECGFLEDEGIDAAIWVGAPGSTGCNAIGKVLRGEVNPSGKLADTYAYDATSAPSYYNFGSYEYTNVGYINTCSFAATAYDEPNGNYHYVDYEEGIYVGYRYYETRYINNETGMCDEEQYTKTVQYPFGYGLSYTEFEKEIAGFVDDGKTISMKVQVTNSGAVAGKEVVEVYYTAPYTVGGIEKSYVVLAGYEKTELLEPGETQEITISFDYEDMASYDYSGIKAEGGAYVLEAGEYQIKLMQDAHTLIESRTVTVDNDIIYNSENDGARSTDGIVAVNQFDDVTYGEKLKYVSRSDWEGTLPKERRNSAREASEKIITSLENNAYEEDEALGEIVLEKNNLELADMAGLEYDDPQWEKLLNQLTVDEMSRLIQLGGWATVSVDSIDKPYLIEVDGPAGINDVMTGMNGNQFMIGSILCTTWNRELAEKMGLSLGAEAAAMHVAGVYAPAINTHRSPFGGRNFEYFSEDGYLAGTMVAAEIRGIQTNGIYCYLKHFALNDQETHRSDGGLCTWANEQAMREIYFRPFEIAVKEADVCGMMTALNRLGTINVPESSALLETVLEQEWGFRGTVVTDSIMACSYINADRALLAGTDLILSQMRTDFLTDNSLKTPTGNHAMRNACHDILFIEANSSALENAVQPVPYWLMAIIVVDMLIIALFVRYYIRRHKRMTLWKNSQGIVSE